MLLIESIGYGLMSHSACPHFEDSLDNGSGFGIDQRSTLIIVSLVVAVGAERSHILACLSVSVEHRSQLFGGVGSVPQHFFSKYIHYRYALPNGKLA